MAIRITANVQIISHLNGTATTSLSSALTIPSDSNAMVIQNADDTNNLLLTVDGTNFFTIYPHGSVSLDVDDFNNRNSFIKVKSSAATVAYQCLFGAEV